MHETPSSTLPCAAALDLLPLYCDGLCSPETRALVEAHLARCPACKAQCDAMRASLSLAAQEPSSTSADETLRAVRRSYRTIHVRTLLVSILVAVLVFIGLALLGSHLQTPHIPLTAQEMDATALYRDAQGKVWAQVGTTQYRMPTSYARLVPDLDTQVITISMVRPAWPYATRQDAAEGASGSPYPNPLFDTTLSEDGRMEATFQVYDETVQMEVETIRIGNETDGYVTIWQSGDGLPPL